jgi:hypothetical protein
MIFFAERNAMLLEGLANGVNGAWVRAKLTWYRFYSLDCGQRHF